METERCTAHVKYNTLYIVIEQSHCTATQSRNNVPMTNMNQGKIVGGIVTPKKRTHSSAFSAKPPKILAR